MSSFEKALGSSLAAFTSPAAVEMMTDRIEKYLCEKLPDLVSNSISIEYSHTHSHAAHGYGYVFSFKVAFNVFPHMKTSVGKVVEFDHLMTPLGITGVLDKIHEDLAQGVAERIEDELLKNEITFSEYCDMYGRDKIAAALRSASYSGGGFETYDPYIYKKREATTETYYSPMRDLSDLGKLKDKYDTDRDRMEKAARVADALSEAAKTINSNSATMSEAAKAMRDLKGRLEDMEKKKDRGPHDKRFTSMTVTESVELLIAAIKEVNLRLALETNGKGYKVGCDTVIDGHILDEYDKLTDVGFIRPHGASLVIDIQNADGLILPLRLKDLPDVLPDYWKIVQDELEYGETFADVKELAYFYGRLFGLGRGIVAPMCDRIAATKTAAIAARIKAQAAERAKHYEGNPQYGFL